MTYTGYKINLPLSTTIRQLHSDKDKLCEKIIISHGKGPSYRQIGTALHIHWRRMGQIIKSADNFSLPHFSMLK